MTVCAVGACRLIFVVSKGIDQVYNRVDVTAELGDFTGKNIEGGALVEIRLLLFVEC